MLYVGKYIQYLIALCLPRRFLSFFLLLSFFLFLSFALFLSLSLQNKTSSLDEHFQKMQFFRWMK